MPTTYPAKLSSVEKYIKNVPSARQKAHVRNILRARMKKAGLDTSGRALSRNPSSWREKLADSIFEVEDRLESRAGGMPDDPVVVALREARIRVYVDLRWEEA